LPSHVFWGAAELAHADFIQDCSGNTLFFANSSRHYRSASSLPSNIAKHENCLRMFFGALLNWHTLIACSLFLQEILTLFPKISKLIL